MELHLNATPAPKKYARFSKYGHSVSTLRDDVRKNYFKNAKALREHYVDRLRNIISDHGFKQRFETMIDLKKFLSSQKDAHYNADQLLEEITEIENELLQKSLEQQAEQQESDLENMINHNLVNYCIICDKQVSDNMCRECQRELFSTDF